jgi:hypothetical protein
MLMAGLWRAVEATVPTCHNGRATGGLASSSQAAPRLIDALAVTVS